MSKGTGKTNSKAKHGEVVERRGQKVVMYSNYGMAAWKAKQKNWAKNKGYVGGFE